MIINVNLNADHIENHTFINIGKDVIWVLLSKLIIFTFFVMIDKMSTTLVDKPVLIFRQITHDILKQRKEFWVWLKQSKTVLPQFLTKNKKIVLTILAF